MYQSEYLEFAPAYFCSINVKYTLYVSLDTWSLPQYISVVSMLSKLYRVSLATWSLPQYISVVSMLSMLYMYHWLPGVCPSIFL